MQITTLWLGRETLFVHKQTQKLSSLKRADQPEMPSAFVPVAMFRSSAWTMHLPMTKDLESGAVSASANVAS